MDFLTAAYRRRLALGHRASLDHARRRLGSPWRRTAYLAFSGVIGSEFLPHLDEGAIWARGTLADSTSLTEGDPRFTTSAAMFSRPFPR
jgi:cobalt-zinc-cadmium resistance protein CzcA